MAIACAAVELFHKTRRGLKNDVQIMTPVASMSQGFFAVLTIWKELTTIMIDFVFARHLWLAVHALILFMVGIFISFPVIRYNLEKVSWLPRQLFRMVVRLMGDRGIVRTAVVIWLFNSTAIFLYMASGFHPLLPKIFGVWTGLNVAVLTYGPATREDPVLSKLAEPVEEGVWQPSPALSGLCGLLVLVLELPCFWFSIAMGIRMGHHVQAGTPYLGAMSRYATAYGTVVVPILFVSAVAESIAVRGGTMGREAQGDEQ